MATETYTLAAIEWALAAPALIMLAILLLPIGRTQLRARFAPQIAKSARSQVPFVLWVQDTYRRPGRDWLIKASAWTVTVDFYVLTLPTMYFIGWRMMTMQIVSGMALVTYATCGMKDLMCSPRPVHVATAVQRKKLLVLEKNLEVEYGTPSMHTSLATFMNVFLISVAFGDQGGSSLSLMLYALSATWACWIAATRIYLGVHTPVDLLWGAMTGVSFFALARVTAQAHLQAVLQGGPSFGYFRVALDVWALLSYPRPQHYTTSYLPAVTFLGAWTGFNISYSGALPSVGNRLAGLIAGTPVAAALAQIAVGPLPLRVLTGLLVVAVTRVVSKALLAPLLPRLFRILPSPIRRALQPPIHIRWLHATNYREEHVHDTLPHHQPTPSPTVGKQAPPSTSAPTRKSAAGASSPAALMHGPKFLEGWAVRADGYPLDADFWRRYLSYGMLTLGIVEFDRLLEAIAAAAAVVE